MNLEAFKSRIKIFTYVVFGLIAASIFIRIVLRAFGASESADFTIFWYDFTNYFVGSFEGIYNSINPRASRVVIETYSIVAFFVYIVLSIITSRSLLSVTTNDSIQKTKDVVSAFFKIMEFFLISRFILMLTNASTLSSFVRFVYSVSSVVSEPFNGIFPTQDFGESGVVFETSTLIAIVIVIVFDLLTDRLVDTIRQAPPVPKDHRPKQPVAQVHTHQKPVQQQQFNPNQPNPIQNQGQYPNTQQFAGAQQTPYQQNPNQPIPHPGQYPQAQNYNPNAQQFAGVQQNPNQPTQPQVQNFHFNVPSQQNTPQQPATYVDKRSVNVYPGANNNLNNTALPGNQELKLENPHDMLINDASHNTPSTNDFGQPQSIPPSQSNIPPLEQ